MRQISESTALFLSKEYKKPPGDHHRAIFCYGGRRVEVKMKVLIGTALKAQIARMEMKFLGK